MFLQSSYIVILLRPKCFEYTWRRNYHFQTSQKYLSKPWLATNPLLIFCIPEIKLMDCKHCLTIIPVWVIFFSQSSSIHLHIHLSCSSTFLFGTADFLTIKSISKHTHKVQSIRHKTIITALHPGSKNHTSHKDYWPWGKRKRTWLQLLRVTALLTPSESFGCVEKARPCSVI